ncbi:hypothetical protein glysoja_022874 [Glycine soja]|nr:hypothetical protein glysoja_022874 [Glycine soja]
MSQFFMLAIGLIVEVAHATRHPCSPIIVNAMLAITISKCHCIPLLQRM